MSKTYVIANQYSESVKPLIDSAKLLFVQRNEDFKTIEFTVPDDYAEHVETIPQVRIVCPN